MHLPKLTAFYTLIFPFRSIRRIGFILILTTAGYISFAQCNSTFKYLMSGSGKEFIYDVVQLSGGDLILAGQTSSFGSGATDIFLTRVTLEGSIIWSKTYGGSQNEELRKIHLARDGDILLTGQSRSFGNPSGNPIAMKIDLNGNVKWSARFDEPGHSGLGLDILATTDNGFVVSGTSYDAGSATNWMVAKLDATGKIVWNKNFDRVINEDAFALIQKQDTVCVIGDAQLGAHYSGVIVKMALSDGTVYESKGFELDTRGAFGSKIYETNGQYRIAVDLFSGNSFADREAGYLYTDQLFNPDKAFKIQAVPYDNYFFSGFYPTKDGGFICTGSPNAANSGYVYKMNSDGTIKFSRRFSTSANLLVYSAIEASDSSIWVVGSENDHALVMKLDSLGSFQYCVNEPVTRSTVAINYRSVAFSWGAIKDVVFGDPAVSLGVVGFGWKIDTLCKAPLCMGVELTGRNLICTIKDSISYLARTSGSCTGARNWIFPAGVNGYADSDTTVKIKFPGDGDYPLIVEWKGTCQNFKDTLQIKVVTSPGSVFLGNDSVLCNVPSLQLDAGGGFKSYQWQDNSMGQTFVANHTGTYSVKAYNYCNEAFADTVTIRFRNISEHKAVPGDTAYCIPGTVQLDAMGGDLYSWSPKLFLSNPDIHNPLSTTPSTMEYSVRITDTVCHITSDQIVRLTIDPVPSFEVSKTNDIDCTTGSTHLSATGQYNFTWLPAESLNNSKIADPVATPDSTTVYTVIASNKLACTTSKTITVNFNKTGGSSIFVPTAFTPNKDGKNDVFRSGMNGSVKLEYFSVYNRWGQLLFTTQNKGVGWDGTYHGIPQPPGVYVWMAKAFSVCSGELFQKGTVLLIR